MNKNKTVNKKLPISFYVDVFILLFVPFLFIIVNLFNRELCELALKSFGN